MGRTASQQAPFCGRFHRLSTHVYGSGVGLFLVKRLIENANRTSTGQRQLAVGTAFTVSLPA